jgi:hypothetical protein
VALRYRKDHLMQDDDRDAIALIIAELEHDDDAQLAIMRYYLGPDPEDDPAEYARISDANRLEGLTWLFYRVLDQAAYGWKLAALAIARSEPGEPAGDDEAPRLAVEALRALLLFGVQP